MMYQCEIKEFSNYAICKKVYLDEESAYTYYNEDTGVLCFRSVGETEERARKLLFDLLRDYQKEALSNIEAIQKKLDWAKGVVR